MTNNNHAIVHTQHPTQDALAPNNSAQIDAQFNAAFGLQQQGNFSDAALGYRAVLQHAPHHFDALHLLGVVEGLLGHPYIALDLFSRAIAVNPYFAPVFFNRGYALQELTRFEEALQDYQVALSLDPTHDGALCNAAVVLQWLGRHYEAPAYYQKLVKYYPNDADAQLNLSIASLIVGDFATGLPLQEWRWQVKIFDMYKPHFKEPLWLGQTSLKDKTLLLYVEQGLGDIIQFSRYAKCAANQGARVILGCVPPSLESLLSQLDAVDQLIVTGQALPPFDYYCPLFSAPLAFNTRLDTIPNENYLASDPARTMSWQRRIGHKRLPRVGVVWSGSVLHKGDKYRSIALEQFAQLFTIKAEFFCLQQEIRASDQRVFNQCQNVHFVGNDLHDFSDTAALLELMDIVITVDTSVAHLAGAMGKPVWVMVPWNPDWRWLLDRDDSPWYPSMRLFRQPAVGDWLSVIRIVKHVLPTYLSTM